MDPDTRNRLSVDDILARNKFHYERLLAEMPIEPRVGFLDFFREVRNLGLKFAIGSLTPKKYAITLLERSGLMVLFGQRNIVLREHVANPKPAPDVFLKTASIMEIDPHEQLVFEDSPPGVKAALAAGSKAIGMPVVIRGITIGALVDAGICRIFFDWREIDVSTPIKNLS